MKYQNSICPFCKIDLIERDNSLECKNTVINCPYRFIIFVEENQVIGYDIKTLSSIQKENQFLLFGNKTTTTVGTIFSNPEHELFFPFIPLNLNSTKEEIFSIVERLKKLSIFL